VTRKRKSLFNEQTHSRVSEKAVKGASASILAQLICQLVNTVGAIILARLLSPQDFGLVAMVMTFVLLAMNFGENGFPEYVIQKENLTDKELSTIFWTHITISTILMVGFIAASPFVAKFYDEPVLENVTFVLSLGIVIQTLSTHHVSLLKRNMQFEKVAFARIIATLTSVLLSLALALTGFGFWAIVARQLSIPFVIAIVVWILCPWRPGFPDRLHPIAGISLNYALRVYGNFALNYYSRNVQKILIGRFHGSQSLGFYDRAYSLSSMPAGQLVWPLHSVALSALSKLRGDPLRFRKSYLKSLRYLAFPGVLTGLLLSVMGRDIILVLLGSEWEESGNLVRIFGVGISAMLLYQTHGWLHLSLGKPERWLKWSLISSGLTSILLIIAVPFGIQSVALAYSLTYLILLPIALWYGGKPIGIKMRDLIQNLLPFFASASITGAVWILVIIYFENVSEFLANLDSFPRMLIAGLSLGFVYVVLVLLYHRSFDPVIGLYSLAKKFFSLMSNKKRD